MWSLLNSKFYVAERVSSIGTKVDSNTPFLPHTAPQHVIYRAARSLHINHMQMSINEVYACRLCAALHTACCGAVPLIVLGLAWSMHPFATPVQSIHFTVRSPIKQILPYTLPGKAKLKNCSGIAWWKNQWVPTDTQILILSPLNAYRKGFNSINPQHWMVQCTLLWKVNKR